MGRNNERNIKKHNDKLHKAQDKVKQAEVLRKEKLKEIMKKFNEDNNPSIQFAYLWKMKNQKPLKMKFNL